MTGHQTRAERARMPLAREVVRAAAVENGVCIRPVSVRKVDRVTGVTELVDLPCGATLASKCPSCAERARRLRIAQCREGWHLDAEPIHEAKPATVEQRTLATARADLERALVDAEDAGEDPADVDAVIGQVDGLVAEAGVRGRIGAGAAPRRVRSTRRRQDVADRPRRRVDARTVGRVYGERFRPSLFVTATLDFHDLRHTGNAFAAKVPGTTIRDLMSRMGHDSTRAALIYLHSSPGADGSSPTHSRSSWTTTRTDRLRARSGHAPAGRR